MAKLTLSDILGQYASTTELNNNFALIETALENTLSRDGSTPNTMSADLDMNSNNITNANSVQVNGQSLVPGSVVAIDTAASVPNVPAGNIAATDVQAALNELDTEKMALAGTETVTGDKTFSGSTTFGNTATFSKDIDANGGVNIQKDLIRNVGSDLTSASSLTLGTGSYYDVTGTTTITSISTLAIGLQIVLQFDDILILTHHSTDLVLPGAANITTAAGDIGVFYAYEVGKWRCISYTRAAIAP